jgi:nicotinate-nucleotide adenylyltransferase
MFDNSSRQSSAVEPYIQAIKSRLSNNKFRHSLNVAKEAKRLAKKYGADPQKAEIAGILHDIFKEEKTEKHLQIIERFGIILTNIERKNFKLWHAITGSAYVKFVLKIDDLEIYNAIRYHTSARGGMSLLEKVVFVADFTSKDRNYSEVNRIRADANISLEKAMKSGLKYTIRELLSSNLPIDPGCLAAYNDIVL